MISQHTLNKEQWVERSLREVFEFFSSARNLEELTPPWLKFEILAAPDTIEAGARIQYRIRWHGIPLRWTTEILVWRPPQEFVDFQLSGPYKLWHHTHRFEEERGGTRITDVVQYALPLGPLGWIAHALWVGNDVRRIFEYRRQRIEELFGPAKVGR